MIENKPSLPMPIKATPYQHQIRAFDFICEQFGLVKGGDKNTSITPSILV